MVNLKTIDSKSVYYKILNEKIREAISSGAKQIELINVNGQRYIGGGITEPVKIKIDGVPGNDLGSFMNGPEIFVDSNAQDGVGNTMNGGKIVIKGMTGDVCGYGMRGGKIFILGDAGYRVGIHMKGYKNLNPIIVIGGNAGNFLAEYMAGGVIILIRMFGRKLGNGFYGDFLGAGMHGGTIYVRGEIDAQKLGSGVGAVNFKETDRKFLDKIIKEYAKDLGLDSKKILSSRFVKLMPLSNRPYSKLYTY